jgi:anthranilate phosphoribosyltransferase
MELREAIARVSARKDLGADEMAAAFGRIMDGEATPGQIGALLVGLKMKGETVDEIVGAARAMRVRAEPLGAPDGVVDTCGTGGDGAQTMNVSTVAALVVAACGVPVAKHGNRAVSSRAGSADLLEALGVAVDAPAPVVERCLREVGIGFLFAPAFHRATRYAAPVRREIGVRTLFNLLGPLTNPAGARRQVMGVYDGALVEPIARALGELGSERAMVVHGDGGLDEFAPAGATRVAELHAGRVRAYALRPGDFGLEEHDPAGLAGGDPAHNAAAARAILDGDGAAPRAAVAAVTMTAAAALLVAGVAPDLRDGTRRAREALASGAAARVLGRLAEASRREAAA